MKNVTKPLTKSVPKPLVLTASASGIHKKFSVWDILEWTTKLIISNKEMTDIIKIAKSLEEPQC